MSTTAELHSSGTPTDPIWWLVCLSALAVLVIGSILVLVDTAVRRARQNRAERSRRDDVEAQVHQRAESARMLRVPAPERCLHSYGPWVCIAAPHPDAPRRHYYVSADRASAS